MDKKAQLSNLYQYVLIFVLVGLVLGVGVVLLDKFSVATYDETTSWGENDTLLIGNGTITLSYAPNEIVRLANTTNTTIDSKYYNFTGTTLSILNNTNGSTQWFITTYLYDRNSSASTSLFSTIGAIVPIASDWMPVIVIVAVVGIILSLVLGAFSSYNKRQ